MIALIAPAKRLDYDSDLSVEDFSIAEHLKESKKLIKELQKKFLGHLDTRTITNKKDQAYFKDNYKL